GRVGQDIFAAALEGGVGGDRDHEEEVAGRAAIHAWLALTRQPHARTIVYARRNAHLQPPRAHRLPRSLAGGTEPPANLARDFAGRTELGSLDGVGAHRAGIRLAERDLERLLQVLALAWPWRRRSGRPTCWTGRIGGRCRSAAPAKERVEEVGEAGRVA